MLGNLSKAFLFNFSKHLHFSSSSQIKSWIDDSYKFLWWKLGFQNYKHNDIPHQWRKQKVDWFYPHLNENQSKRSLDTEGMKSTDFYKDNYFLKSTEYYTSFQNYY